jgi:hypothetical protein
VHDFALALYNEGMYGDGWMWISNIINPAEVAAAGQHEMDVWQVMQGMAHVDLPVASDVAFSSEYKNRLLSYVRSFDLSQQPAGQGLSSKDAAAYSVAFARDFEAAKLRLESDNEDGSWFSSVYFYDAVRMFLLAVDGLLRDQPGRSLSQLSGEELFNALTNQEIVGFTGRIVVDGFGTKEGFYVIRNVWGKTGLLVYLLDTYTQNAFPVDKGGTVLTDLSGHMTWRFNGSIDSPVVFPGNTSTPPQNRVVGVCLPGTKLVTHDSEDEHCAECDPGFYSTSG